MRCWFKIADAPLGVPLTRFEATVPPSVCADVLRAVQSSIPKDAYIVCVEVLISLDRPVCAETDRVVDVAKVRSERKKKGAPDAS